MQTEGQWSSEHILCASALVDGTGSPASASGEFVDDSSAAEE
jgi:hypothetical protein